MMFAMFALTKSPLPTSIRDIVVEGMVTDCPGPPVEGPLQAWNENLFLFAKKKNCEHHKLQSCMNKLDKAGISQKKKKAHIKRNGRQRKQTERSQL